MTHWKYINDGAAPPRGVRLIVLCECGWWGVGKLTVHGWRGDDGKILPSLVIAWMEID